MRNWLIAFSVLVLSACAGQRWLPDVAYDMRETAVLLQSADYGCSGTIIAANLVLTAAHCLPGPDGEIKVIMRNGATRIGKTAWQAEKADVGVIAFDGAKSKVFAQIDCKPMEWGEPVQWVGNPSILQWNYGSGYVSQEETVIDPKTGEDTGYIVVHANFNPGDSGAGLISEDGRIRGVVSAFLITRMGFSVSQSGNGLMTPASGFCAEMEKAL
jgi:S1-C subfamily serine protease